MEYCDHCGSKIKIIYKAEDIREIYINEDGEYCIKLKERFWKYGKEISQKIWIERYQKFVKNLNEAYKKKFKERIRKSFGKYFICSNPNCYMETEDKYWRNEDAIRQTSFRSLRR